MAMSTMEREETSSLPEGLLMPPPPDAEVEATGVETRGLGLIGGWSSGKSSWSMAISNSRRSFSSGHSFLGGEWKRFLFI